MDETQNQKDAKEETQAGRNELVELKELVEFLKANDVAEFGLVKQGLRMRLKFQGAAAPATPAFDYAQLARLMPQAPVVGAVSAPAPVATVQTGHAAPEAAAAPASTDHIVKSPIVGTFYESPSPGAAPFVKVGDLVSSGQVLCIVEAMKLMNEIESDMAGEIVERIAVSGEPVEYGQPLFAIRPR